MTNLVGHTLLNRYRVLALIGEGGMADVYKAHDQLRNAELALKVLKPDLAQDGSFVHHFREEAEALMELDHPNIVRFYSIERDGDIFFIVMDYVEGITLREEMQARSGRLGNEKIARVMRGVCAALEYAHKSGYVHRDIKPTNILIGNNQVFLTDFGIARLTGSASSPLGKVGTPGYMSPEQIRGETTSPSSDIYSLGVLLYEMAVGMRPFTGQSMQTTGSTSERVRWEQLNLSPPAPRRLNPSVSPYLERIILCCLEKDPARRFSSAAELWNAFEQSIPRHAAPPTVQKVQAEQTAPRPSTPTMPSANVGRNTAGRRKRNALLWVFASVLILFVGVFAVINGGDSFPISTPVAVTVIPTLPDTEVPATRPALLPTFSVRPYNEYTDSKLEMLWDAVGGVEFPASPGHYTWEANISANATILLHLGWCAADETTLEANLRDMEFEIALDGFSITDSQLRISKGTQNELSCQQRAGVLSRLEAGQHTYIEIIRIKNAIFDGAEMYEAGEYIYELTITAR